MMRLRTLKRTCHEEREEDHPAPRGWRARAKKDYLGRILWEKSILSGENGDSGD